MVKNQSLFDKTTHQQDDFSLTNNCFKLMNNLNRVKITFKGSDVCTTSKTVNEQIESNLFLKANAVKSFDFFLNQTNVSRSFLNERFSSNLSNYFSLVNNSAKETVNRNTQAYMFNFNFMNFNKLLQNVNYMETLNSTISNQLKTVKSQKFLYNYSMLHRKILKNSHKLTMTKQLLTSGFYDTTLTEKNL
jgi:hypothetical protein